MKVELENRLIDFSVSINHLVLKMNKSMLSQTLGLQVIRSATSSALNYGEVQGAESRKDFTHKMSIVLKELRETEISLKIIYRSNSCGNTPDIVNIIAECKQLIAIFQKSINTLRTNTIQNKK